MQPIYGVERVCSVFFFVGPEVCVSLQGFYRRSRGQVWPRRS